MKNRHLRHRTQKTQKLFCESNIFCVLWIYSSTRNEQNKKKYKNKNFHIARSLLAFELKQQPTNVMCLLLSLISTRLSCGVCCCWVSVGAFVEHFFILLAFSSTSGVCDRKLLHTHVIFLLYLLTLFNDVIVWYFTFHISCCRVVKLLYIFIHIFIWYKCIPSSLLLVFFLYFQESYKVEYWTFVCFLFAIWKQYNTCMIFFVFKSEYEWIYIYIIQYMWNKCVGHFIQCWYICSL